MKDMIDAERVYVQKSELAEEFFEVVGGIDLNGKRYQTYYTPDKNKADRLAADRRERRVILPGNNGMVRSFTTTLTSDEPPITRTVGSSKTSGRVYVPRGWTGRQVTVIVHQ